MFTDFADLYLDVIYSSHATATDQELQYLLIKEPFIVTKEEVGFTAVKATNQNEAVVFYTMCEQNEIKADKILV